MHSLCCVCASSHKSAGDLVRAARCFAGAKVAWVFDPVRVRVPAPNHAYAAIVSAVDPQESRLKFSKVCAFFPWASTTRDFSLGGAPSQPRERWYFVLLPLITIRRERDAQFTARPQLLCPNQGNKLEQILHTSRRVCVKKILVAAGVCGSLRKNAAAVRWGCGRARFTRRNTFGHTIIIEARKLCRTANCLETMTNAKSLLLWAVWN
jgi:hypothetical protein